MGLEISNILIITRIRLSMHSATVLQSFFERSRHKRASAEFVESCFGGGSTPAAKPMAFRPA